MPGKADDRNFQMEKEAIMTLPTSRIRAVFAAVFFGLTVSACGYNTIPTLEEQAKAKWADVQNNYQRRADLSPNLVATVQGYAKQENDVLTSVVEARAKATQVKIDASQLTDPEKLTRFQDARTSCRARLAACSRSAKNIPTSSRTRTSWRCSRNLRALRATSRRRGGTTSRRRGPTTPSSRPSRACCGRTPCSAATSRWRSSPRAPPRRARRK